MQQIFVAKWKSFRESYDQAPWYWWLLAAFFAWRLLIIFHVPLIDDEAYHWTWAKNLSWSYFDHPGMVAWAIWPWISIFGDHEAAVRLGAVVCLVAIVTLVYKLGRDLFGVQVGRLASLLLFVVPLWGFASLGTLPDVPLGVFWVAIAFVFWQSVRPEPELAWSVQKSWLWIGVWMGFGMNSKLTCCLIGLGMGLYLLTTKRVRWHLATPWPYLGALITFLMMTPIFWWNSQNGWATFDYQFSSRHTEAAGADWNRWLQFWVYQVVLMSPGVFALIAAAFVTGISRFREERWRWLFCLAVPSIGLFYYQSLFAAFKPHWSGPAYLILLFGACELFLRGVKGWWQPASRKLAVFTGSFLVLFFLLYIPLLTPVIPRAYSLFAPVDSWNSLWDPTNEFYGWREVGAHLRERRQQAEQEGGRSVQLGAQRYEVIAQAQWGSGEKVWRLSKERSQYFFEQSDELLQQLYGERFLVITSDKYNEDPMAYAYFDQCTPSEFPIYRNGIFARKFYIYDCSNFQGPK